jgi:hypothetical protein
VDEMMAYAPTKKKCQEQGDDKTTTGEMLTHSINARETLEGLG